MKGRPRRLRTWAILAAVLLALGAAAYRMSLGTPVPTVQVVRQPLTETVISSGRVITPDRIAIGTEIVGHVAELAVEEGDRARAGQMLLRLDDTEQRAATEQARRALEEAEARLAQWREVNRPVADQALRQAEANEAQAQRDHARVKELTDAGFYSPSRLDEARRALDTTRAARESAQAQARGHQADGVEQRLAQARLAQARAAFELAAAKQAKTVIRAPADGLVVRKLVEPGDIVTQGRQLIELAADGETQIVLQVDEKNLGRLAVGQKAGVLADAYPGQPFAAEIFYIAPAVDAQKGAVEVKLRVPAPPAFVKPDMTVSVEIQVGRRESTLTLPSDAVRDLAGQPWILAIEDGRTVRRPVRPGLVGTGWVEVREGARAGEAVIPASVSLPPGRRVRPQ